MIINIIILFHTHFHSTPSELTSPADVSAYHSLIVAESTTFRFDFSSDRHDCDHQYVESVEQKQEPWASIKNRNTEVTEEQRSERERERVLGLVWNLDWVTGASAKPPSDFFCLIPELEGMEGDAGGEFLDWEVLPCSDAAPLTKSSVSLIENSDSFVEIGGDSDSEGIIRSNYFSLDNRYLGTGGEFDLSEDGSVESDNPSWIDPGLDNRYVVKNSPEFWSDSGSDRSEERKAVDVDAATGLGAAEFCKGEVVGELAGDGENVYKLDSLEGKFTAVYSKDELGFSEIVKRQMEELDGDELVSVKFGDLGKEPETELDGFSGGTEHSGKKVNVSGEEEAKADENPGVDEEKKKITWWKVPFEVLKYCAFRASPVWSFSMAAAVMMGVVILGRRLHKLKRKSQSLKLNVTVDDKKVSQFMSRAARLNEAFSVVRRVPMVRPSLPAAGAGIHQWPAMSMR